MEASIAPDDDRGDHRAVPDWMPIRGARSGIYRPVPSSLCSRSRLWQAVFGAAQQPATTVTNGGGAMNVLQVTPRYPPRTGGVETHVRELSERLVERGHDVCVTTADSGPDVQRKERLNGVRVVRHRGIAPGGAYHFGPGVVSTIRSESPDVVHAHSYHSLTLPLASFGTRGSSFVATTHYHAGSHSRFRDLLLSAYRPVGRRALHRAAAVVAVSEWERRQLRSDFDVDAEVVPNGIDLDRFGDREPLRRDRPYLLTVGRLESYKGVQHAVRALEELPQFDLLVCGTGPYEDELRSLVASLGVDDRVSFRGYVPDEELPSLYAGASAYLALSTHESFGLTVGESLAAGTPCVVRRERALAEWMDRDDCVGVDDVDPAVVAAAIEETVGRSTDSSTIPTWEDAVDDLESLYAART